VKNTKDQATVPKSARAVNQQENHFKQKSADLSPLKKNQDQITAR
jgi:hypothetical protein